MRALRAATLRCLFAAAISFSDILRLPLFLQDAIDAAAACYVIAAPFIC